MKFERAAEKEPEEEMVPKETAYTERPPQEAQDFDVLRSALQAWFEQTMSPQANDVVVSNFERTAAGSSNETYLFELSWKERGEPRLERLVIRLRPRRKGVYPEYDFERQCRLFDLLRSCTDIPVPHIRAFEPNPKVLGTPFYIMYRAAGRAPNDFPPLHAPEGWFGRLSGARQSKIYHVGLETLAFIHSVDWRACELTFLERSERGVSALDQQLNYSRWHYDWARGDDRIALIEKTFDWLEENKPSDEEKRLSWGDARLGNMMFEGDECTAVLDWEVAGIADPALDVSHWLLSDEMLSVRVGVPRLSNVPTAEQVVRYYEQVSGRNLKNLSYYMIFDSLRTAIMMIRMATIMAEDPNNRTGYTPSDNIATRHLENVFERFS